MKPLLSLLLFFAMGMAIFGNSVSSDGKQNALNDDGSFFNEGLLLAQAKKPEEAVKKEPSRETAKSGDKKDEGFAGSILTGASTIGGMNFQQIGFRGELPIGRLGLGMDILIQLDERGHIRKEDWDKPEDYLDKIYYIRWARKGDPFYIKVGGLDFTYLGYGSSIYGYSNMVEYPTYKRTGMELAFDTKKMGGEFIFNNFKELINDQPSMVVGGRLYYKIISILSLGVSYAADLNVRNGLRDDDGDGYPDEIDQYPYDSGLVTEIDRFTKKLKGIGVSDTDISSTIDNLVNADLIDGTRREDIPKFFNDRQMVNIVGADLGVSVVNKSLLKWDFYSQAACIIENNSWGISYIGTRIMFGNIRFSTDFRQTTDKFIFGFFNNTYELERAKIDTTGTKPRVITKLDSLESIEAKYGAFASLDFNIFDIVTFMAGYQDLIKGDQHDRSLNGELKLKTDFLPLIDNAKAYYVRNDFGRELDGYFDEFARWKTPGTIMGYMVDIKIGEGVIINFDYKYTFEDKNGDGKIEGKDETIKTIAITTSSRF